MSPWDVRVGGPVDGPPRWMSKRDTFPTAVPSHGDTKHPLLFPASVQECYTMAMDAFDLAEELQTPVFVMSDLDLGMNVWMSDTFPYPDKPPKRGRVLTAEDLEKLGSFERYR